MTFAASLPVALSAGTTYSFSLWSEAVGAAYNLDEKQISLLGTACNLGGYSSFVSGLIYDWLSRKHQFGPRIVLLLGILVNSSGYSLLYLAGTGHVHVSFPMLFSLCVVACSGGTYSDTTALATNIRNFPSNRGTVVGLIKTCVGLSAAVYSLMYSGFLAPHALHYLLFLAIAPAIASIPALLTLNHVPFIQSSELESGQHIFTTGGRFLFAAQTLGTVAIFLMADAIVQEEKDLTVRVSKLLAIGGIVLLLPLILVPYGSGGIFAYPIGHHAPIIREGEEEMEEEEEEEIERVVAGEEDSVEGDTAGLYDTLLGTTEVEPELEPSVRHTLASLNFYLLAFECCIGMGAGLTFLNNTARIVLALEGDTSLGSLIGIFAVCNAAGRMLLGWLPERVLHSAGIPRPFFLIAASLLTSLACAATAFASSDYLEVLAAAFGFAFGSHWSLMPSLAADLFGLKSFATIYTVLQIAPACGSLGLASWLTATLYSEELRRQGLPSDAVCLGRGCFRTTFLILTISAGVGCIAAASLLYRTRRVYQKQFINLVRFDSCATN